MVKYSPIVKALIAMIASNNWTDRFTTAIYTAHSVEITELSHVANLTSYYRFLDDQYIN